MDGCSAVILWEEYRDNGNKKALESLLAHSAYDAVDLDALMVLAYNLNLERTRFLDSNRIIPPKSPEIPVTNPSISVKADFWGIKEVSFSRVQAVDELTAIKSQIERFKENEKRHMLEWLKKLLDKEHQK